MLLAAAEVAVFELFDYWIAVGGTMALITAKSLLIVAYYQHLRWENRSLTGLMALATTLFLLLMVAASFSIT
jgi:cytochrome c oxidase subunit 4